MANHVREYSILFPSLDQPNLPTKPISSCVWPLYHFGGLDRPIQSSALVIQMPSSCDNNDRGTLIHLLDLLSRYMSRPAIFLLMRQGYHQDSAHVETEKHDPQCQSLVNPLVSATLLRQEVVLMAVAAANKFKAEKLYNEGAYSVLVM